jgi:hypothetical protein
MKQTINEIGYPPPPPPPPPRSWLLPQGNTIGVLLYKRVLPYSHSRSGYFTNQVQGGIFEYISH